MPGNGIPSFNRHSVRISREGIYILGHFRDSVVVPTLEHWQLDGLTGIDDTAKIAKDYLYEHLEMLGEIATKQADRLSQKH